MDSSFYRRLLFGACAVLFGVIALLWRDPETWQTVRHLWSLPAGLVLGCFLMILQIAAGLALPFPRTVRLASIILSVVYACFSLAAIPGIVGAPAVYAQYGSFFEQFSLFCGVLVLVAATSQNAARSKLLATFARFGFGLCALSFALTQLFYLQETAALVPRWIPPSPLFWAIFTTIAFALAALAILIHRYTNLALNLMTLMLALFAILVWLPRLVARPHSHFTWSEFALTALITASSSLLANLKSL